MPDINNEECRNYIINVAEIPGVKVGIARKGTLDDPEPAIYLYIDSSHTEKFLPKPPRGIKVVHKIQGG